MSTSRSVSEEIDECGTEFGVELPDGRICLMEGEAEALATVAAAKVVNPRSRYKARKRTHYVGEWRNA